jgi:peptidoglycan glycosyltransferase
MMVSVVDNGTGTAAQLPGIKVAGKTGTADNGPQRADGSYVNPPHAWFSGFAPADNPKIAVAVIIENGGVAGNETTGGLAAAPVAKAVMQAYLASQGVK